MTPRKWSAARGGTALLIVILSIAIASLSLAGLQSISFRQAAAGRETVARLRAYWAARAGLEETIARFGQNLQSRDPGSFYAIPDDLAEAAEGRLAAGAASWRIRHDDGVDVRDGPADPHAKLNINLMSRDDLLALDGMTEDVADAILDWIDPDDEPHELGAEIGYYSSLPSPYDPRNAPMRSLFELELVAGIDNRSVRGEDWNLNGILDPSEDDGDLSWPSDNADGILDAGWSAIIGADGVDAGMSPSGRARLSAIAATADQLIERVPSLTLAQASAIIDLAAPGDAAIEQLITTPLSTITGQDETANPPEDLTDEQIRVLLDEATFADPEKGPAPGRANVNTISRDALDYVTAISPGLADALILARDTNATGYTNILDLLDIPSMSRTRLVSISRFLGVESSSYVVTSVGRDDSTGIEVQLVATLSGTALPITISEMRTR